MTSASLTGENDANLWLEFRLNGEPVNSSGWKSALSIRPRGPLHPVATARCLASSIFGFPRRTPLAFTAASAALVPAGDQGPLLLCQGRVEMKHEGVNVRAKLGDHERDWGIKVANVELKHVDLNETMVRAIQAGRGAPRHGDRLRRASCMRPRSCCKQAKSWPRRPRPCQLR
jgi:hypothetical protein